MSTPIDLPDFQRSVVLAESPDQLYSDTSDPGSILSTPQIDISRWQSLVVQARISADVVGSPGTLLMIFDVGGATQTVRPITMWGENTMGLTSTLYITLPALGDSVSFLLGNADPASVAHLNVVGSRRVAPRTLINSSGYYDFAVPFTVQSVNIAAGATETRYAQPVSGPMGFRWFTAQPTQLALISYRASPTITPNATTCFNSQTVANERAYLAPVYAPWQALKATAQNLAGVAALTSFTAGCLVDQ